MKRPSANEGYTLIETIVAMVLLIGVLVPLIGAVAMLVLDQDAAHRLEALQIALHRVNLAFMDPVSVARASSTEGRYQIEVTTADEGRLRTVVARVSKQVDPAREFVAIERSAIMRSTQ